MSNRFLSLPLVLIILVSSLGAESSYGLSVRSSGSRSNANPMVVAKELTALSWDGKEFLASYGVNNSRLLNVSLDGKTIQPFAPSFKGDLETYVATSDGKGGFPKGYRYVNSDPVIYEISATGQTFRAFSNPPGASRIAYVAFDTVGTW